MAAKKILFLTGDFAEDYETMVPFQALQAVGVAHRQRGLVAAEEALDEKVVLEQPAAAAPFEAAQLGGVQRRVHGGARRRFRAAAWAAASRRRGAPSLP